MGGMLAVGAASLHPKLARAARTITLLGSGCFGAGSWHAALRPLLAALCLLGFPGREAGGLLGAFAGTGAAALLESVFYWRSNMEVRAQGSGGVGGRGAPAGGGLQALSGRGCGGQALGLRCVPGAGGCPHTSCVGAQRAPSIAPGTW